MNEIQKAIAELKASDLFKVKTFDENGLLIEVYWETMHVNHRNKTIDVTCTEYTKTPRNESIQPWVMRADNTFRIPVVKANNEPLMISVPTAEILGYQKKMMEVSIMGVDGETQTIEVDDLDKPIYATKLVQKTIGEFEMWQFYLMYNHYVSLNDAVTAGIMRRSGVVDSPLVFKDYSAQ